MEGEERFNSHDLPSWISYSLGNVGGEMIHGARIAIQVPKVVVLSVYDRLPRLEMKFTRRNVFLRDHFTCQYCTKVLPEAQLNLDHVMPRDKGGRTTWDNIVTSCFRCNTRKGNKLPHEANMHPRCKPIAPRWRPLYGMHENGLVDESWTYFLPADLKQARRSA